MASIQLDIVTPQRLVFSGEVSEVRVPGWEGEFGVLPEHELFLSLVRGGVVRLVTPQGEQRFVVGRGFAEAGPERVTVLTDSCLEADQVDKAAAQQDLAAAEKALTELSAEDPEWDAAEEKLELARGKLAI